MRELVRAILLDGNLTGSVTSVNTVNTDAVGSYTMTYSVSDANGNAAADSVVRVVNVVDTTKPVITLGGQLQQIQHDDID